MGPVIVTCDGCGVRIRIPHPETALDRQCPRCSTPLASALTKLFKSTPPPEDDPILGINFEAPPEAASDVEVRTQSSGVSLLAACVVVFLASALSLGIWLARQPGVTPESLPDKSSTPLAWNSPQPPIDSPRPSDRDQEPVPAAAEEPDAAAPERIEGAGLPAAPEVPGDPQLPGPLVQRTSPATVASREPVRPEFQAPSDPAPPPPPQPDPAPATQAPPDPVPATARPRDEKRVRIRTKTGEIVVARVHGQSEGRISVLLPDGEIGFTSDLAETDEPFRPASKERIRQELTRSGPFAGSNVLESEHYLVLYKSSTPFAEASIKLLENLYKNLTVAFKKRELPIHDPEFPLVAIIFRTEKEFRAHQKVDADVQAYYEILSNRIYLYEKSDHDQQSPEVAALRKPQTVAHEGTHQILQNIGIHPRLAPWPLWLVEGFAEYCSPPTMARGRATWAGLGHVNPMHMATIHDLDDPASQVVSGANRQRLGRDRRKPLVEYLVTKSSLTPTDYALSWALTHYLAMVRGTAFLSYIKTMSQLPPLEERTPDQQLAAFREAFGPDLAKLDKTVATYLAKLKYEPLPYYAVVFEQPIPGNQIRRATIVSQSPSMIRQWLAQISDSNGGSSSWEVFPHPTRARAVMAADQWIRNR